MTIRCLKLTTNDMHDYEKVLKFGGGLPDTFLSPAALVLTSLAVLLIFLLPRRYVVVAVIVPSFFITMGQQLVLGGLHLYISRLLVLAAWIRLLASGWQRLYQPSRIDKAILIWGAADAIAFFVLWHQPEALINRLGFLYNLVGFYFLFRLLFHNSEDIDRTIKTFAVVCFLLALCMINEKFTSRNLFWVFGGVPEFTGVREGSLRAQGPFAHPILAGTFGAMLLPLFVGLYWQKRSSKWIAFVGVISALVMVFASSSATPLMAVAASVIGFSLWPLRKWMRVFRWGLVLTVTGLHIVMKAPVWALIARVDVVGGSSGDHRYELVNQFIRHFPDWWLVGTKYTGDWGYLMHDVSNEFVGAGTEGGLAGFILFIWIIVCCFQALGRAQKSSSSDGADKRLLWSLGTALFTCVVAFFGIAFFDQTSIAWYALLAMIASSSTLYRESRRVLPQAAEIDIDEPLPTFATR